MTPRPHYPLVTKIEASFLGQLNPPPEPIVIAVPNLQATVNQWLAISCLCFIISFIVEFIFVA